jgi:hypothetical protein
MPQDSISDPLVMPTAALVLAALVVELEKTAAGQPAHTRITPGTEMVAALTDSVDECCEGIASVRVRRVFTTENFPEPAQRPRGDGGPVSWGVELEMAVARCGAEPGDSMAPSDAQITGDSQVQLDDAAAMRRAVRCLADTWPIIDSMIGDYEPLAAEGNCIGGVQVVTVQVECAEC